MSGHGILTLFSPKIWSWVVNGKSCVVRKGCRTLQNWAISTLLKDSLSMILKIVLLWLRLDYLMQATNFRNGLVLLRGKEAVHLPPTMAHTFSLARSQPCITQILLQIECYINQTPLEPGTTILFPLSSNGRARGQIWWKSVIWFWFLLHRCERSSSDIQEPSLPHRL